MNEADQIYALLTESAFWESEERSWSMNMPGGIFVGIDGNGSNWTWRITRANGDPIPSPQAFPSIQTAKKGLRAELKHIRDRIIDEGMGPGSMS